jgi:hypothetical protein
VGTNLWAPQANERGKPYWSYSLIRQIGRGGDVVFHYHTPTRAIVGWSLAVGHAYYEPIVWAARGASAQEYVPGVIEIQAMTRGRATHAAADVEESLV